MADSAEPLDLQLLERFVPDTEDRSQAAHALCRALEIDLEEMADICADIFSRRRTMASERWPDIQDGIAVAETFVVGIAYGYQLALERT